MGDEELDEEEKDAPVEQDWSSEHPRVKGPYTKFVLTLNKAKETIASLKKEYGTFTDMAYLSNPTPAVNAFQTDLRQAGVPEDKIQILTKQGLKATGTKLP